MTSQDFYIGRRLSYAGAACTIRYVGEVQGTKGEWLGVEWDDSERGKHSGVHQDIEYFNSGRSKHPTAGSFIRPSRPFDKSLSFVEALQHKYASENISGTAAGDVIEISGKTVEEVGFEKIQKQLANLPELRIVVLDRLCLQGLESRPFSQVVDAGEQSLNTLAEKALKTVELDISQNLLEEWADVVGICCTLSSLENLKLNGNHFRSLSIPTSLTHRKHEAFKKVKHLSLDSTFLSWDEIISLATNFPTLTSLSLVSNTLTNLTTLLPLSHLTTLSLASNDISTLSALSPLTNLPSLQSLILRSNRISTTTPTLLFPTLTHLDLTSNAISTYTFINSLPPTFPQLSSLLISHNPLYPPPPPTTSSRPTIPPSTLLTIARLPTLTSLNFSNITPAERKNAELYYLSTITAQLSASPASLSDAILADHPRWSELCNFYGVPTINRQTPLSDNTNDRTLAARLITFTFVLRDPNGTVTEKVKQVPKTVDIYRLKGIIGRLFGVKPMKTRLMWETGELDPVGEDDDWSGSEDDVEDEGGKGNKEGKWMKRETELVSGTREVGFWIEERVARVRVEMT